LLKTIDEAADESGLLAFDEAKKKDVRDEMNNNHSF